MKAFSLLFLSTFIVLFSSAFGISISCVEYTQQTDCQRFLFNGSQPMFYLTPASSWCQPVQYQKVTGSFGSAQVFALTSNQNNQRTLSGEIIYLYNNIACYDFGLSINSASIGSSNCIGLLDGNAPFIACRYSET